MDGLGFTLAGFVILAGIGTVAGIVFAVDQYRRWKFTGWSIPLAMMMAVVSPFIFPVIAHLSRPRMHALGVDRRMINLKLWLAWFVPIFTSVGIKLCEFFCNRVVDHDFSEELALCCGLCCVLLYQIFMIWMIARLDKISIEPRPEKA